MKFKKSISFVLTLCMVLSLFATFVIPASAEATNLAAGKTYTITDQFRAGGKEVGWGYDPNAPISYPDDGVKLTDGTTAPADNSLYDAAWAGFNHNTPSYKEQEYPSHKITVDLGAVCDIDSASIYLATRQVGNGAGIDYMYSFVSVKVSEDGETWTDAGYVEIGDTVVTDELVAKIDIEADVSAQYVQFRLTRSGWLFVSEVEVYGTAAAEEDDVLTWEDGWVNDPADTNPNDGQNLKFDNAYGYTFVLDADKVIGGEDNVIITNVDDYNACNPNWAISVLLVPTEVEGIYAASGVVVPTPGSAANAMAAGINFDNGNIVLVAHSSASHDAYPNWQAKLCALALKEGDLIRVSETEAYVLIPNVDEVPEVPEAPEAPEAGLTGANVSQWAAGSDFAVLTDGYNGVGEVNNYDPYQSKLFGVASGVMEATDYTLTFVVDEQDFNTITLYALDFANGGVMLPDAVTFVVNGVEYEAAINANANGIATIVATLDEAVTANCVVANVAMGASPYSFPIFNMYTEIAVSVVEEDDDSFKDTYTYVDGVTNGTSQSREDNWESIPVVDFWYLVEDSESTVTVNVAVDNKKISVDDTMLRIWIDTDPSDTARTTLVDVKVKDGAAYVARCDGGYDAAVLSATYEVIGNDYFFVVELDKATLGIDGQYGLNIQLGQAGYNTLHSITWDAFDSSLVPWSTTAFYEIFGEEPEVEYNEGWNAEFDENELKLFKDVALFGDGKWGTDADAFGHDDVILVQNLVCKNPDLYPELTLVYNAGTAIDVNNIKVGLYVETNSMISYPSKDAKVYVSTDGIEWTPVESTTDIPESVFVQHGSPENSLGTYVANIEFATSTAQYVKVVFTYTDSPFNDPNGDYKPVYEFIGFTEAEVSYVEPSAELPEDATVIDYLGYIHDAYSMVAYAEADMTLGELVAKYLGQSKDLNYCKVAICDGDGTVVAVYLTLGREPAEGPNGVKTNLTIAAGQFAVIYNANKAGHEVMDGIKVGDTITLYNVDALESHTGTAVALENAGFTVEAEEDDTLTIEEAIALGESKEHNTYTEEKYYVTGVITKVYNETYGNMYITDENGNTITVYGTYSADGELRYDAMEVKPVAGDTVTVYGIIGQYNGNAQLKNAWITNIVVGDHEEEPEVVEPEADSVLSIENAIALGESKDHNTYTAGKYYVTGVITEVYNETYGNMYITDENGNTITVYGTYSADGELRYDAMEVKPVAGDTVTVYGIIGQYNGNAQLKNAWITEHVPAEPEAPELNEVDGGELPSGRGFPVTVPANTALSYVANFANGADFILNDTSVAVLVNGVALEGEWGYEAKLVAGDVVTFVNTGAEEITVYPMVFPVVYGTMSNPIVLDELGDITANVTEDIVMDGGAVHYLYTAPANGTLTITMPEGNWTYTVNNLTAGLYGDSQWSDSDPVLSTYSIEVTAGDEIQIIVGTYNPESMWDIPVGELTFNAVFEEAKPEASVELPENLGLWASGNDISVLTNGTTGVGEIVSWESGLGELFGIANSVLDASEYSFTVVFDETEFNTVTVYALDFLGGYVPLPESVVIVVNGTEYDTVITPNEDGIATIVADLDEAVTASAVTVKAVMSASPYDGPIFNMYSEVAVSLVEEDDESYKETHTHVDGVNVGTIQQLGADWEGKPDSNFWYLVTSGAETITVSVVVDDRTIVENNTMLRVWIETDKEYSARTTLVDVKVKDGAAYVARCDGGYDAAVLSVSYKTVGNDYYFEVVLDKATLGITGEYGLNITLSQDGSTSMHSIKYDNVTGEGATYAPWITTEFYEIFDKVPELSNVVTDWNPVNWEASVGGATGAFIYNDAEVYANCLNNWWIHVAFKPSAVAGVYEVTAVREPGETPFLTIPENGFVWMAWTSAGGTPESAGAYALAFMNNLEIGDLVYFAGVDFANQTAAVEASAIVVESVMDLSLLISHNYNYNWHCFEGQFITNTIADGNGNYLVKAGDAPNMSIADEDVLYVVELVDGAYLVTAFVTGSAIADVVIPDGGFLYYITSNCTSYASVSKGELVGSYILIGDIDLNKSFAIDTQQGQPAYPITVLKSDKVFNVGDVNLNGEIDAADYAIVRKLVLGTLTAEDIGDIAYARADVNGDGVVNARDYYLIKRAYLGTYVIPGWEVEDDAE